MRAQPNGQMYWIAAAVLYAIGLGLLVDHGVHHWYEPEPSHARQESCVWVGYFQPKDVAHCESWTVVLFACGLAALAAQAMFTAVVLVVAGTLVLACGCFVGLDAEHVHNHETWIVAAAASATVLLLVRPPSSVA